MRFFDAAKTNDNYEKHLVGPFREVVFNDGEKFEMSISLKDHTTATLVLSNEEKTIVSYYYHNIGVLLGILGVEVDLSEKNLKEIKKTLSCKT